MTRDYISEIRAAIEEIKEDNLKLAKVNAILLLNEFNQMLHKRVDIILGKLEKLDSKLEGSQAFNRIDSVLALIGNVDHSKGHGANSAKLRGELLNDIRTILIEGK